MLYKHSPRHLSSMVEVRWYDMSLVVSNFCTIPVQIAFFSILHVSSSPNSNPAWYRQCRKYLSILGVLVLFFSIWDQGSINMIWELTGLYSDIKRDQWRQIQQERSLQRRDSGSDLTSTVTCTTFYILGCNTKPTRNMNEVSMASLSMHSMMLEIADCNMEEQASKNIARRRWSSSHPCHRYRQSWALPPTD